MDLSDAINRHRTELLRIVGTMFAMIGLADGEPVERIYAPLYHAVLRLLRPAESAVRRLIVIAARGLTLKPAKPRVMAAGSSGRSAVDSGARPAKAAGRRRNSFQLFDPRQRHVAGFSRRRLRIRLRADPAPRLHIIDVGFDPRAPLFRQPAPVVTLPQPARQNGAMEVSDGRVDAERLCRRLAAIRSALEDLPCQALRYLRWQARPAASRRPQRASALRPGRAPGFRKFPVHAVDEILAECDRLARQVPPPDSS